MFYCLSIISINAKKHHIFITCNEKVEGSIPFSGTKSNGLLHDSEAARFLLASSNESTPRHQTKCFWPSPKRRFLRALLAPLKVRPNPLPF